MQRSLDQWVDYIQTLHHREIELSLERVREVYLRLYPAGLSYKIINLSGTNGKGSTAELLASIYRQAGYRVGKFTSPHLVRFNERFNLDGESIDDHRLLAAFVRVEAVRQDTPITFFEYGTLLAIELFASQKVDVAIMEVGLGGRLDSVNILDADVSIVTSVSIDHTSWLGNTVEQIAYQKVGIARKGKPLILGLANPPQNILEYASEVGAKVSQIGRQFNHQPSMRANMWNWLGEQHALIELPLPYGQAGVQLDNCSLALEAVWRLLDSLPVSSDDIHLGIKNASILGRCQILQSSPSIILDVSHNETSIVRLAEFLKPLKATATGRVLAVCGMLRDKEIKLSLDQISMHIDEWHISTIHHDRGATAAEIGAVINSISDSKVCEYERVEDAYDEALAALTSDDCLVVFGSFHIVGDILSHVT